MDRSDLESLAAVAQVTHSGRALGLWCGSSQHSPPPFFLFGTAPAAYGSSQAKGRIRAAAASLHHSHSNVRSDCFCNLHHSSRQCWILNLLSEDRDQTCILLDASSVNNPLSHNGNSSSLFKMYTERLVLSYRNNVFIVQNIYRPIQNLLESKFFYIPY